MASRSECYPLRAACEDRGVKKLLTALVVLALLAVGLDRGGVLVAERVAGSSLQSSQGLAQRPEVSIDGFPFLDQVARGAYDRIEVRARDVPLGDAADPVALRLARLDVVLVDVETSRDFDRFDVRRARASALISYADLSEVFGVELSFAGDGRLTVRGAFRVLGQDVEPEVTVAPAVVDGALRLGEISVAGAADVLGGVAEVLDEVLGVALPLQGIPFSVEVDDLSAQREGLVLELSGADLSYVRP